MGVRISTSQLFAQGVDLLRDRFAELARTQRQLATGRRIATGAAAILQRARELAVRGANDTLSAADREAIAREVDGLVEDLLAAANATDGNGNYLFAGYRVRTEPFARKSGGGFEYRGDEGQPRLEIGPGQPACPPATAPS